MAAVQRSKTNRVQKMNSLLEHLLGGLLLPYIKNQNGISTITKVETSQDLRWAKVWISIVGGNDEKIMGMLIHNLYDIQGELNRMIAMKMVPRISFHLDTSGRYAQHINEIFHKIEEERQDDSDGNPT